MSIKLQAKFKILTEETSCTLAIQTAMLITNNTVQYAETTYM